MQPWFHVSMHAGEEGAGRFERTREVHRQLWQFERDTYGGPVFGEGYQHWYWSGLLDGVEAQFGMGWPANTGMTAPLMVDFDLLKIHPLQFNHGMGYYERWWNSASWGGIPPMAVLDQYRMQEVAYGHAGFLGNSTWANTHFAWLEHHLMTPVTARYATAKPADISYQVSGKWVDGTTAARNADWSRVRIRYDSGLTVTANNSPQPMCSGNFVLPQYGWLAQGAGVTAYTAMRDGRYADYAETADSIFANARNAADWNSSEIKQIRPTVSEFQQAGPRTIRFSYNWQINDTLTASYDCFVHFSAMDVDVNDDKICFQQGHTLAVSAIDWKPGRQITDGPYVVTIPDSTPDGDYRWMIGLCSTVDGSRASLLGPDDGRGRIRLGVLHVRDAGRTITFDRSTDTGDDREKLYTAHLNMDAKVVDFGTVRTNGSILIRRESGMWVLRTLPRDAKSVVEISAKRLPKPASVTCTGGSQATLTPESAGDWWKVQLNGSSRYCWPAVK
jgi:hypothetical protein